MTMKRPTSIFIIGALAALMAFFLLAVSVAQNGFVTLADHYLASFVPLVRSLPLDCLMSVATNLGSPIAVAAAIILLFAVIWRRGKSDRRLFLLIAGLALMYLNVALAKNTLMIERPANPFFPETGFGFPSGHAAFAAFYFLALWFSAEVFLKTKRPRRLFASAAVLLPLLIGLSRIYFNAHFVSDVLGGFLVGIFWFTLSVAVFELVRESGSE